MDLVEVEITGLAITQRYGTLTTGQVLRTDAAYAAHLVNDAGCARYVGEPPKVKPAGAPEAPRTRGPRRKAELPAVMPLAGEQGTDAGVDGQRASADGEQDEGDIDQPEAAIAGALPQNQPGD